MRPAQALLITAAGALLVMSHASAQANIEAGEGDMGTISTDTLMDGLQSIIDRLTETPAGVSDNVAARNLHAALQTLYRAEGTAKEADPYRVCYGYRHTIADLSEHPAITGEWRGEKLPDEMCRKAGFGPGCISTAAGAGQLIKPTWIEARDALGLPDFSPNSQEAAIAYYFRKHGALQDVYAGRVADWVRKCRGRWASLPGNYAGQGQRSLATLQSWYEQAGGTYA